MVIFPNAKINLGLHVTSKRSDGYHTIESVFYPIQLHDTIEIHAYNPFVLKEHQAKPSSATIEENTIYKAWKILSDNFNIDPLRVDLIKNIPSGAGLGGGSSDASHMLKVCNDFFKLNLSQDTLLSYAQKIGSDCSFFIHNKPCFVSGIGHNIQPISLTLPELYIAVIYPSIHVSTQLAYSRIQSKKPSIDLLECIQTIPIEHWKHHLVNDFEESVFLAQPVLSEIKQNLYDQGAMYASMSGSGSAIYGLFTKDPIEELKSTWPNYFTWSGKFM
jgi:4-diphosphocytidyl-2-C-methyl-D-erythritol kinase